MKRLRSTPRTNWQNIVESQGMFHHTLEDETPYWDESAYYEFSMEQINLLEKATNELHEKCLEAVQYVINKKRYQDLAIPKAAIPLIEDSWNNETPAIYGRFDLAWDGTGYPKMLEYNADTPTSLLEAAVIHY